MSPTVLRSAGFRFSFYSRESAGGRLEPPHVHARKGGAAAKVWLDSVEVAYSVGCSPAELRQIRELTRDHRDRLLEAWHDHFREPPR
ncbi:MAG: DUF4160 domain-containing protein [Longimicrobiales bacterium]